LDCEGERDVVVLVKSSANATSQAAKRSIDSTFGLSPVDCGNGWCCIAEMECISGDPPWCPDLLIQRFFIEAAPYSDFDPARLASLGLMITPVPSTAFTATDALST
jgi:hypothetical protein